VANYFTNRKIVDKPVLRWDVLLY